MVGVFKLVVLTCLSLSSDLKAVSEVVVVSRSFVSSSRTSSSIRKIREKRSWELLMAEAGSSYSPGLKARRFQIRSSNFIGKKLNTTRESVVLTSYPNTNQNKLFREKEKSTTGN